MAYTHVAVIIHWATALIIIGLLAVGKYMTGLDPNDALRFTLTQTHKTFGILVLALSVLRVLWRLTHRAPAHPVDAPTWEKLAAGISHLAFYALIFVLPLSGWAMVSVSTLNIDTLLFNRIELPHIPLLEWLNITQQAEQESLEHSFHYAHHVAGTVLIVLLIVHIGAALKHHFVNKDDVLRRMKPRATEPGFLGVMAIVAVVIGGSVYLLNDRAQSGALPLTASESQVSARVDVTSDPTDIIFSSSSVVSNIDLANPSASSLEITVQTASATSDNLQVQGALNDPEWFDSANYPDAVLIADEFVSGENLNTLEISGQLSIKDVTVPVTFTLIISPAVENRPSTAVAEFEVNRMELMLGLISHPDDENINPEVQIRVEFVLSTAG